MLDFSSSLYLGLRHASRLLPAWSELSAGKPAALEEPAGALRVAWKLAALQGCEGAALAPSTLHLYSDLLAMLSRDRGAAVFVDSGSYPIARWGADRARAHGAAVVTFRHHDVAALRREVANRRVRPVVVADGICPSCSGIAPIAAYALAVEEQKGMLVIDDTQALGILGEPAPAHPWGVSGGGSLRYHGVRGAQIVLVSSLAKAFGVPVAALSGAAAIVRRFVEKSQTRVHCSPPSVPSILAAERALRINATDGDRLRQALLRRVQQLRAGLRRLKLELEPGLFPIQTVASAEGLDLRMLHASLRAQGIATVLRPARRDGRPRLSFIVTAAHAAADIETALGAIAGEMRRHSPASHSPGRCGSA